MILMRKICFFFKLQRDKRGFDVSANILERKWKKVCLVLP